MTIAAHAGPKPALVLGGGGAFGIVQAAYIQAAFELGFRPSLVVGTSVGALNGAWVALHPDEPGSLLEIWQTLHRRRVLRSNPLALAMRAARRRGGIFRNDLVSSLLSTHIGNASFSDTEIPLAVVATNLSQGYKHVFGVGRLAPAIMASTSIPGLFEPVRLNGDLFVDGSVTASVDLATAVEMGATEILAVDLTPRAEPAAPRTSIGVLRQTFGIFAQSTTIAMEQFAQRLMPTCVIRPDLSRHTPWQIHCDAEEVRVAVAEARAELASILDSAGHVIPSSRGMPRTAHAPATQLFPGPAAARLRLQFGDQ
jgi:NTE family protein